MRQKVFKFLSVLALLPTLLACQAEPKSSDDDGSDVTPPTPTVCETTEIEKIYEALHNSYKALSEATFPSNYKSTYIQYENNVKMLDIVKLYEARTSSIVTSCMYDDSGEVTNSTTEYKYVTSVLNRSAIVDVIKDKSFDVIYRGSNADLKFALEDYAPTVKTTLTTVLEWVSSGVAEYNNASYATTDEGYSINYEREDEDKTTYYTCSFVNNLPVTFELSWSKDNIKYSYVNEYDYKTEFDASSLLPKSLDGLTTTSIYTEDGLYENACKESALASESDIKPLITLTKDSSDVLWDESGEKVMVMTLHNYPSSYVEGSDLTINWSSWVTSPKEFINRYSKISKDTTDWTLRMKQLLGMPASSKNAYIACMYVNPSDLYRPAYYTDVTKDEMALTFSEDASTEYQEWFNSNMVSSYLGASNHYPWSRLGYTVDWAYTTKTYGLSEFIINKGATASVYKNFTIDEFVTWASAQSSAAKA